MFKMRSVTKQSQSLSPSVPSKQVSDLSAPPTVEDVDATPLTSFSLSTGPAMNLDVKMEFNVKADMDASPASPSTLVADMLPQKFKSSPTPTPPPSTKNGTPTKTSASPPPTPVTNSRKPSSPGPQLIGDLPIARTDALSTFNEISANNYQNKSLGRSREVLESMTCDCLYEHGVDSHDKACGPYSDCINRLTQVECLPEDCRCRSYCQNQRFQKREYANIEIVLTEKKGFGLRAEEDLPKDTFIYEYVGDVVNPTSFKKRMRDYALEGIQHFYFMMLQKDEFIDATKGGGIGRFANHSCSPNCYVAKWTIGHHVRMGIFAKRDIKQYEELTFNYNVDRYGHQAQTCYCGEPNCVGFIGGKTQTDIVTMDDLYLDALGITDEQDLVALKGTKKKKGKKIDDPDFMPMMKPIVEKDVPKVVQAIRQTQSRKVLYKLLTRIKITEDQAALRQIMRLRGYTLMKNVLDDYPADLDLILLSLECMNTWPLLNRNKVVDSRVTEPVKSCTEFDSAAVKDIAQKLLEHWESLPLYNRIPKRVKKDDEDDSPVPIILANDDDDIHEAKRLKSVDDTFYRHYPSNHIRPRYERGFPPYQPPKQVQPPPQPHIGQDVSKAKREEAQAIIAAAAESAAKEEEAAAAAAAEAKAKAQAAEERAARKKTKGPKKVLTPEEKEANKEKRLLKLVGAVVVKCMSKYAKSLNHDLFKKHAKELTQVIAEKEKKSSSYREGNLDALSEEKISKIKKFAKEYITKILRKLEKSGKHDRPSSSSTIQATPSTSMATPNSADGDVVMDVPPMSVEEAMDMDPDSASEGEGEEDEENEGWNGAVTSAELSWIPGRPPPDMFTASMDVIEVVQPVDPRRRPSLDDLSR